MRMLSTAAILLSGAVVSLSAQGAPSWVEIADGQNRSRVAVVHTAPYSGAPWASIAARPQVSGVSATANAFAIRAWEERGNARIVVYAVTASNVNGKPVETMAQVGTYALAPAQSVQFTATARYGARPVTLTALAE